MRQNVRVLTLSVTLVCCCLVVMHITLHDEVESILKV